VGLGHRLGLETVAEGVETAEQAAFLRALDCRTAQGFLFAKPMPLADLESWLEAWAP
jgi:EAL domain-containing protein (putative c-di-GMP-specific phosphodiesterase class I)